MPSIPLQVTRTPLDAITLELTLKPARCSASA